MFEGIFGNRRNLVGHEPQHARFSAASEVEAYWQALREKDHIPKRNDLDPRGIRGALSKAFVLDATHLDEPRFRIVGSDLSDLQQRDLRGLSVSELVAPAKRRTVKEILQDVTRLPGTARLDFTAKMPKGTPLDLRMVLLPMTNANGHLTRILGCLDFDDSVLQHGRCRSLEPIGSIIRPLGQEQNAIERRMHCRGLKLVSSSERVSTVPKNERVKPILTLVRP